MLKSIAALLLVFLMGCANTVPYADWTHKERKLYKYYLALQVIDTAQTGRAINCQRNNDQCTLGEANPIYGKRPSMEKLIGMKIGLNALFFVALGKEKTLYKYYLALQVIDTAQTGRVINCQRNNDRCTLGEANPIYGKRPSMEKLIGMKIGLNALFFVALGREKTNRVKTLKILNTTMTVVIGHNQLLLNKAL